MQKKNIFRLLFFLILFFWGFLFAALVVFMKNDLRLEPFLDLPACSKPSLRSPGPLKIGIIGDSWVAGGKLDKFLHDALFSMGLEVDIISSGHPGANSRQIYRNLVASGTEPYSSRRLLMDDGLDYMVVVAGVNDAATHFGAPFYTYHMLNIIRSLIQRGIRPVILEVPEFGIAEMQVGGIRSWTKRAIYRTVCDNMHDDVIESYRKALASCLTGSLAESVIIVPFGPVALDYSKSRDIYSDPSHLNQEGCRRLAFLIAGSIYSDHVLKIKQKP